MLVSKDTFSSITLHLNLLDICVKLNLFNYVLALFYAKFACNSHLETLYLGGNNVRVVYERV